MIADAIRKAVGGAELTPDEVQQAFVTMMRGEASDAQKASLLIALRMKGETAGEILGAARAMRENLVPIATRRRDLVDTCGTGGDGRGTFNVSTAAALIASAAGVAVAKHGNRAVSSACGSADVLVQLGVTVDLEPDEMASVLDQVGVSFLFAPRLHPAMAAVAGVRRELGVRTIFNLLGPLTNPASVRRQVLGVYEAHLVPTIAAVLRDLGSEHVLVVHSDDGLDELSVSAPTTVAELRHGEISVRKVTPADLGLEQSAADAVTGGDAAENARLILEVLGGREGPAMDIALANAGAAIYVGGGAASLREGVEVARRAISSGMARVRLDELIAATASVREVRL